MVNSVTFHFSFALQCLGEGELSAAEGGAVGGLVHDSHAEVVAKRAFQLYLIDQIRCGGGLIRRRCITYFESFLAWVQAKGRWYLGNTESRHNLHFSESCKKEGSLGDPKIRLVFWTLSKQCHRS